MSIYLKGTKNLLLYKKADFYWKRKLRKNLAVAFTTTPQDNAPIWKRKNTIIIFTFTSLIIILRKVVALFRQSAYFRKIQMRMDTMTKIKLLNKSIDDKIYNKDHIKQIEDTIKFIEDSLDNKPIVTNIQLNELIQLGSLYLRLANVFKSLAYNDKYFESLIKSIRVGWRIRKNKGDLYFQSVILYGISLTEIGKIEEGIELLSEVFSVLNSLPNPDNKMLFSDDSVLKTNKLLHMQTDLDMTKHENKDDEIEKITKSYEMGFKFSLRERSSDDLLFGTICSVIYHLSKVYWVKNDFDKSCSWGKIGHQLLSDRNKNNRLDTKNPIELVNFTECELYYALSLYSLGKSEDSKKVLSFITSCEKTLMRHDPFLCAQVKFLHSKVLAELGDEKSSEEEFSQAEMLEKQFKFSVPSYLKY